MPISPQSGALRLQILPCMKYYNVLKWKNRLTLRLNAAKNTDYMKKSLS